MLGVSTSQITGLELGNKYARYRNKKIINMAYDVDSEVLEPTELRVQRIHDLLTNYSREEIIIANDLQTAIERVESDRIQLMKQQGSFKKPEKA